MLFYDMSTLLTNILKHLINKKSLSDTKDGVSKIKPIHDLVKFNLNKKDHLKSAKLIEVGTKSRSFIQSSLAVDEDFAKFCSYCCKCFAAVLSYLQMNLSFSIKILEYAQYLHSGKQNDSLSLNSISNLVLNIANIYGSKVTDVFNVSSAKTPVEIVDMVRHEWKMYQLKEIPESLYLVEVEDGSGKVSSTSSGNIVQPELSKKWNILSLMIIGAVLEKW